MPEGNKDGAERRYHLRATPSRKGRVDDGHQGAGEARFPDNGGRLENDLARGDEGRSRGGRGVGGTAGIGGGPAAGGAGKRRNTVGTPEDTWRGPGNSEAQTGEGEGTRPPEEGGGEGPAEQGVNNEPRFEPRFDARTATPSPLGCASTPSHAPPARQTTPATAGSGGMGTPQSWAATTPWQQPGHNTTATPAGMMELQALQHRVYQLEMHVGNAINQLHAHQHSIGWLGGAQEALQASIGELERDVLGQQELQQAELAAAGRQGGVATQTDLEAVRQQIGQLRASLEPAGVGGEEEDHATLPPAGRRAEKRWRAAERRLEAGNAARDAALKESQAAWEAQRQVERDERVQEHQIVRRELLQTRGQLEGILVLLRDAGLIAGEDAVGDGEAAPTEQSASAGDDEVDSTRKGERLTPDPRPTERDQRLQELHEQLEAQHQQVRQVHSEHAKLLEGLQAQLEDCSGELKTHADWLEEHDQQHTEASEGLQAHGARLTETDQRLEALRTQWEGYQGDAVDGVEDAEGAVGGVEDAEGGVGNAEGGVEDAEGGELGQLRTQVTAHGDQLAGHDQQLQELSTHGDRLAELDQQLQALRTQLGEHKDRRGCQRVHDLAKELTAAQEALASCPTSVPLREAVQSITTQLQTAREANRPEALLDRLNVVETRLDADRAQLGGSAQLQLQQRVEEIAATVAEQTQRLWACVEEMTATVQRDNPASDGRGRGGGNEALGSIDRARAASPGSAAQQSREAGGGFEAPHGGTPGGLQMHGAAYQVSRTGSPPRWQHASPQMAMHGHAYSVGGAAGWPGPRAGTSRGSDTASPAGRMASSRQGPPTSPTADGACGVPDKKALVTAFNKEVLARGKKGMKYTLTRECVGLLHSTNETASLPDFFTMVEALAEDMEPPFREWDARTRIEVVGSRIEATFKEGTSVKQKARDGDWAYETFKAKLAEECVPDLRIQREADLAQCVLTDPTDTAAFLRKYRRKLMDAYDAGTPAGSGNVAATQDSVTALMKALGGPAGTHAHLGTDLWQTVQAKGGVGEWATADRPMLDIIDRHLQLQPPPMASSAKPASKPKAQASLKLLAQLEQTQHALERAEFRQHEAQAELRMSYLAAATEIAARFGPERYPQEKVMNCLGGGFGTSKKICPLCEGDPHVEERLAQANVRSDAWKACPIWIESESSKAESEQGLRGTRPSAADTYVTGRERQGKGKLRLAQGAAPDLEEHWADVGEAGTGLGNGE